MSLLIRANKKIVRIIVWVCVQVNEDGLFLTLAIEQEFDVLVQITPFLLSGVFLLLLIFLIVERLTNGIIVLRKLASELILVIEWL